MFSALHQHPMLLFTIVDRGKGQKVVDLLGEECLLHQIILGVGTAKTDMLDILGLGKTSKDVIMSVILPRSKDKVLRKMRKQFAFEKPGHGIAFTVPVESIGGHHMIADLFFEDENSLEKGREEAMQAPSAYELLVAIVNMGRADAVMDAARAAGAGGGTIVHARGAGTKAAEKFFNITIQPEKEVLITLVKGNSKRSIMEAMIKCPEFGKDGAIFGLPASDVAGLYDLEDDEA